MIKWCVFLPIVVGTVLAVWTGSAESAVLVTEAVVPAGVFAICLLAAMWTGPSLGVAGLYGPVVRIAVAAALAGFLLHNLVTYTLWMPATATVFWISAGAMSGSAFAIRPSADKPAIVSRAKPGRLTRLDGALRISIIVLAFAGFVAACVWLWMPVCRRTLHVHAAQEAFSRGRTVTAAEKMKLAAAADPLDAYVRADLARLHGGERDWPEAVEYARTAWKISPTSSNAILLARALGHIPEQRTGALEMIRKAVELDPMNMQFRWRYAEMLYAVGRFDRALGQIRRIRRINQAIPTISDLRLTDEEIKKLDGLAEKIKHRRTGDG